MKALRATMAIGLAATLMLGTWQAWAEFEVSAGVQINATTDFVAPLASLGVWTEVGSYGRCWRPAHVAAGWRPYCDGHWVWTDCGWYWQTDEPWGWACYHYERWFCDPAGLWFWVPGIEWAPAWVCWREGGGYVGWEPLGPRGAALPRAAFVFVEAKHFQERVRPSRVVANDPALFEKTTLINNIRREPRRINGATAREVFVDEGPGVQPIETATHKQVHRASILQAARNTQTHAKLVRRSIHGQTTQTPATPSVGSPRTTPNVNLQPAPTSSSKGSESESHARAMPTPRTPPAVEPRANPEPKAWPAPTPAPQPAPALPRTHPRYYAPKDPFQPPAAKRSRPAPEHVKPQPPPSEHRQGKAEPPSQRYQHR